MRLSCQDQVNSLQPQQQTTRRRARQAGSRGTGPERDQSWPFRPQSGWKGAGSTLNTLSRQRGRPPSRGFRRVSSGDAYRPGTATTWATCTPSPVTAQSTCPVEPVCSPISRARYAGDRQAPSQVGDPHPRLGDGLSKRCASLSALPGPDAELSTQTVLALSCPAAASGDRGGIQPPHHQVARCLGRVWAFSPFLPRLSSSPLLESSVNKP